MLNYVALAWDESDETQRATAKSFLASFRRRSTGWQVPMETEGLAVSCFVTPESRVEQLYPLASAHGIVLGKLFESSYEAGSLPNPVSFDERTTAKVVASGGRFLLDKFWGQYVAFIRDPSSRKTWVLRDPTGGVPCYTAKVRGIHVYFHRLQDCEHLCQPQWSIDQDYILARLAYSRPLGRHTGLAEVTKVLPGECVRHESNLCSRSHYWNPLDLAKSDPIEDPETAAQLTYHAVRKCVHAWASCYDAILHSLSGGLDSSIVLSCLTDAPNAPRLLCETMYASGLREDERTFARLMARHAGVELVETKIRYDFPLSMPRGIARAAEPFQWWGVEDARATRVSYRDEYGMEATFSGHGGDELFFAHGRLPTAADYLYSHGLTSSFLRISLEDARVDDVSFWRVAKKAIPYGLLGKQWTYRDFFRPLPSPWLSPDVRARAWNDEIVLHPLYRERAQLPPGKIYHAGSITAHASRHRESPRAPDYISDPPIVWPLSSQPFIELSLRIPVYVLRSGGRDRAIARRAFQSDVPAEIVSRRSKGTAETTVRSDLFRHIDTLRELLMHGRLMQGGFLNRMAVDEILCAERPSRLQVYVFSLFELVAIENWYSHFFTTPKSCAV